MPTTPLRPIRYVFVLGKGVVKRRRESENPTQFIAQQVAIQFANDNWEKSKKQLREAIRADVMAEMTYVAGQFRRNVIGAPGAQKGLVGRLTTRSKGPDQPSENLASLPRWAPRDARYLKRKQARPPHGAGHDNWFDNTGWTPASGKPGGTLKKFFAAREGESVSGATVNVGSGGVFEELFGGVSVEILRDRSGAAPAGGTMRIDGRGHMQIQLATIRVRALGQLTDAMLKVGDTSNRALLDQVAKTDPDVALRLRGGRGRYRPTMEPYLAFFLRRALPYAVQQRIARGVTSGRLFVNRSS
jgi:hypothetical protein